MSDLTKIAKTEVTCTSWLGLDATLKGTSPYREEGSIVNHDETPKFLPDQVRWGLWYNVTEQFQKINSRLLIIRPWMLHNVPYHLN